MDEGGVDHIVNDGEGIAEMEPPAKRKRGRPKKVPGVGQPEIISEPPKPSKVSDVPTETNRIAGRMSLRPNRRVDVRKGNLKNIIHFNALIHGRLQSSFLGWANYILDRAC